MSIKLTLLFRDYCTLCHEMQKQLEAYQTEYHFEIQSVDIDDDERLIDQYDELVPVLLTDDGTPICHWHLDDNALRAYLNKFS